MSSRALAALSALTLAAVVAVGLGGCAQPGVITDWGDYPEDVAEALDALPRVDNVEQGEGGVPRFLSGDFGRADRGASLDDAAAAVAPSVAMLAPVFRLQASELRATAYTADELGMTHVRYQQTKAGLDVVGGELIVHVGADGVVRAATSTARGAELGATPAIAADAARASAFSFTPGGVNAGAPRLVFKIASADASMHLAWETQVTGVDAEGTPIDDLVYTDAATGAFVDRAPRVHTAKNRKVYSANNGSSLPGTLKRSEGGAATSDNVVNGAYDNTGTTYDCLKTLFNRDSYNNSGGGLNSTVHYSSNYVNAYWNGSQMVYGDGDGSTSGPLALSLDVTTHELVHGVTQYSANLVYQNEPGALNEGMSDILAAVCEAWKDGAVSADTWKVGEDIWTPGTAGDALRYMNDPVADGQSRDYYPTRYTGSQDNGGVHLNSGIANLAFKLLVTGGTHPRGKTSVSVPAIGIDKAGQIFYRALTNYMTSNTNFAGARTATAQAAQDLYGATEKCAVEAAWAAVGVGSAPSGSCGSGEPPPPPPPPPSGVTTLMSGVAVGNQSGAQNAETQYKIDVPAAPAGSTTSLVIKISGGTGDADLYVKKGSTPTLSSYDARPYLNGNNETVTIDATAGGTWYIMLHGYTAYSGVTIVATATTSGGGGGGNVLQNGVPVTGLSGAQGTWKYYTFTVPAGATSLTVKISGGTGDADEYIRFGAQPTTSSYDGRPYLNGNNETWTKSAPSAGTWHVGIRGYSAYSGVSVTATWQ
jgi:vibriolysin